MDHHVNLDPTQAQGGLSRRTLFKAAAVGAVGAGAAAVLPAGAARAAGGSPVDPLNPGGPNVLAVGCDEFFPVNGVFAGPSGIQWAYTFWGALSMTAGEAYWHAGIHVPTGSTITGMDLWVDPNGQAGGMTAALMRYRAIAGTPRAGTSPQYPDSFREYVIAPNAAALTATGTASGAPAGTPEMPAATGTGVKEISSPAISHVVDEVNWNYRITWLRMSSATTPALFGARIGYIPPAAPTQPPVTLPPSGPVFLPTPVRVYDSRPGGAGAAPKTPFTPGATRTVSCAGNGIPANARGLICNLTATNTTANGGFAVMYPSNGAVPTTSSLNWSAGESVANSVTIGCGPNASVNLMTSVSAADLILDVSGYYP